MEDFGRDHIFSGGQREDRSASLMRVYKMGAI